MDTRKDGKTPDLSAKEQHEVEKSQPPRAAVLHEIIRTQGDKELERSIAALRDAQGTLEAETKSLSEAAQQGGGASTERLAMPINSS